MMSFNRIGFVLLGATAALSVGTAFADEDNACGSPSQVIEYRYKCQLPHPYYGKSHGNEASGSVVILRETHQAASRNSEGKCILGSKEVKQSANFSMSAFNGNSTVARNEKYESMKFSIDQKRNAYVVKAPSATFYLSRKIMKKGDKDWNEKSFSYLVIGKDSFTSACVFEGQTARTDTSTWPVASN